MFALLFFFASATQTFGPHAIWQPDAGFRQSVASACTAQGTGFDACFAAHMKSAGASPEALAFTHAVHDQGYMQSFRRVGPVAVASVFYPFRANENSALLLINGDPAIVDVDALNTLPTAQMNADPAYQSLLKKHPNATLWPGDRSRTDSLLAIALPDGSRQLIAGYRIQAGCHACAVLGQAFFAFAFDAHGKLTTTFTGFTPRFSGNQPVSQAILRVPPAAKFTVLLPANHTTGYSWSLAPAAAKNPLQPLAHDYQSAGKLPGSGGEEHWSFETPAAGSFPLTFAYRRPWEKTAAPARTLDLTVDVRP